MSQEDKKTNLSSISDAWSQISSSTIEKLFDSNDTSIKIEPIDSSNTYYDPSWDPGYVYTTQQPNYLNTSNTVTVSTNNQHTYTFSNISSNLNSIFMYDICLEDNNGDTVYLDNSEMQDIYLEWLEYKDIKKKIALYPTVKTLWEQLKVALRVTDNAEKDSDEDSTST